MVKYSFSVTPEWVRKANKSLYELIERVPWEHMKSLSIKHLTELYAEREKGIVKPSAVPTSEFLRGFHSAMRTCDRGRDQINAMRMLLDEIEASINMEMTDLRNNYPTPYDSEDFVKAWRYAHKDSKRLARFFEVNPFSVEEGKKAYEKFCGLFYGSFHDVPCHIKTFIQADDQRYGEIEFYVDGIVGDFHLYLPQNHMLEYGVEKTGSMKMYVEYSAPDCAGFTTGTYKNVSEGYDLDEIANFFSLAVETKKGSDCELRTMDYYLELMKKQKPMIDEMAKNGDKTYEEYVEYMKNAIMKATKGEL